MSKPQKVMEIVYDQETKEVKYAVFKKDATFMELMGALEVVKHKLVNKEISSEPTPQHKDKHWLTKKRGKKAKHFDESNIDFVKFDERED